MFIRCSVAVMALNALLSGTSAFAGDKEDPVVAFAKSRLKDTAKPFTLVVVVNVKEGSAERFETAFAKALKATRKEKGCITYDLNHDSQNTNRFVVYERWKSLAALERHMKTDHIKALLEVLPDLTTGAPELRILLPAAE